MDTAVIEEGVFAVGRIVSANSGASVASQSNAHVVASSSTGVACYEESRSVNFDKRCPDHRLPESHHDVSKPCSSKYKEATCHICSFESASSQAATNHIRTHDKRLDLCRICELPQISEGTLQLHLYKHIGVRPFLCKLCGRRLRTKYSFEKHHELHNRSTRYFACNACGDWFSSKTKLTLHERKTHAVREWKCRFCEKMFFKQTALEQHENLHTLSNLLRCPHCPKRFSASQSLKNHIKGRHGLISGDTG
ncbi:gastrula zinc finger protein XlCGF49.1-like [Varroa destructor]|uniref:C2H2-type domain-containing protein n=1 Tax=Varroa destructor TaxID=109461 RepID=A0A7M7M575_VARDE|nr:gastrula zinc finger protein XlCGF49.1-like [Varroa destructor]